MNTFKKRKENFDYRNKILFSPITLGIIKIVQSFETPVSAISEPSAEKH